MRVMQERTFSRIVLFLSMLAELCLVLPGNRVEEGPNRILLFPIVVFPAWKTPPAKYPVIAVFKMFPFSTENPRDSGMDCVH